MFDSTWPPEDMPASSDYLIALGAFSLFYNEMEMALWTLFKVYITNAKVRDFLFEELHNRNRVDLIKALLDEEPDAGFRAEAEHGLRCFDRITENRNIMLHAFAFEYENEPKLTKRNRNKPGQLSIFDASLEEVQANALAASNTKWFFFGLNNWRDNTTNWAITRQGEKPAPPQRFPPPDRLSLSQPPEVPENELPPHQSDGE